MHSLRSDPSSSWRPSARWISFAESPRSLGADMNVEILRYRAIVTDTYHVCVNAWNLGRPGHLPYRARVFAGEERQLFGDSLAPRDKRAVFMSMYDALDFLVGTEELQSGERRSAAPGPRGQSHSIRPGSKLHSDTD